MQKVKNGDKIKVEYEGKFEDGTVFDSSKKHNQPLEFTVGSGQVIKGFEEAVMGLKVGDEKTITLPPEQAYGSPRPDLRRKIQKDQLPKNREPSVGMTLVMVRADGLQVPVPIVEVGDKDVTIDLNHPLSGKTLIFTLKVVSIA